MANKEAIDSHEKLKNQWEPMQLRPLGRATSLIQAGGGKMSLRGGDPGDMRKQKGGDS